MCLDVYRGDQVKCTFSLIVCGSKCLTIISGTKVIHHKHAYNPERVISMFMMSPGESAVVYVW
jgi:hypothetical protein